MLFTGFLNDSDLRKLFELSETTLYLYKESSNWPEGITYSQKYEKPTIVTKIESFSEILRPQDAIFIESGNEAALGKAIYELATNNDLRSRLGKSIKETGLKLTWTKTTSQIIQTYDKVLTE